MKRFSKNCIVSLIPALRVLLVKQHTYNSHHMGRRLQAVSSRFLYEHNPWCPAVLVKVFVVEKISLMIKEKKYMLQGIKLFRKREFPLLKKRYFHSLRTFLIWSFHRSRLFRHIFSTRFRTDKLEWRHASLHFSLASSLHVRASFSFWDALFWGELFWILLLLLLSSSDIFWRVCRRCSSFILVDLSLARTCSVSINLGRLFILHSPNLLSSCVFVQLPAFFWFGIF